MNDLVCDMIMDLKYNKIDDLGTKNEEYNLRHQSFISQLNSIIDNIQTAAVTKRDCDGIEGLWYIKNYLTNEELAMIKEKLDTEIELEPLSKSTNSRRVAHYGYYYSYDRSGLNEAPAMPEYLAKLVTNKRINTVTGTSIVDKTFEQLIINEYKPGQQIAYHTDHIKQFGPVIACITIGKSVPIKFKYGTIEKSVEIEPGSMYIMTGDARYKWQHSLKNTSESNRYSLTYRTVNKN